MISDHDAIFQKNRANRKLRIRIKYTEQATMHSQGLQSSSSLHWIQFQFVLNFQYLSYGITIYRRREPPFVVKNMIIHHHSSLSYSYTIFRQLVDQRMDEHILLLAEKRRCIQKRQRMQGSLGISTEESADCDSQFAVFLSKSMQIYPNLSKFIQIKPGIHFVFETYFFFYEYSKLQTQKFVKIIFKNIP